MPRPKRNSRVLSNSERQLESFRSIDRQFDFGNGLTAQAYNSRIDQMRQKLADYNTLLSTVDAAQREVELAEQALTDISKRMMTNVIARYGEDSQEYRMAGGKPRSRRRSTSTSTPSNAQLATSAESNTLGLQNGAKVKA